MYCKRCWIVKSSFLTEKKLEKRGKILKSNKTIKNISESETIICSNNK